jgi:hypothetical protein
MHYIEQFACVGVYAMNVHPQISEARLKDTPEPIARTRPSNFVCMAVLIAGGILTLAWIGLLAWLLFEAVGVIF